MKISTKGRYAVRLLVDIAQNDADGFVRLKDVAKRQNISVKYLEQIIAILSRAGYVRSVRGPQGGYHLTGEPKDYTVGMILRLTEGSMAPVACLEDETNQCERQNECVSLRIWKELDEAIKGVIDKYTLQDLLDWSIENGDNYVI
ncbi:RrF2 family transcriptional regulator [Hespellia stercorisuis]|uniref:Transcriptional regulator, BadM/Rrf2 family n=1 Tax=Hespellia stercorisuis DSM 15480 TaxID=1121950 RepID=A0A1M6MD57_9FIRM|nr:RrF2 family transcriptional regulator [Hespellia stercorisuis]SHJ81346.1 transcriptional regulator, BadM/Rrf2 family [Hespellia stercorisuis DSM 15480]